MPVNELKIDLDLEAGGITDVTTGRFILLDDVVKLIDIANADEELYEAVMGVVDQVHKRIQYPLSA